MVHADLLLEGLGRPIFEYREYLGLRQFHSLMAAPLLSNLDNSRSLD